MLHQILELAQLGTRRLELTSSAFPLERAVHAAAERARSLAGRNGNAIRVRLAADVGSLTADERRLGEVLDALLENACKFTKDGSITLEAARERLDGRDLVANAVSDTGIGMTEDEMSRIFRDFSQADAGPARRFGGAGLGLALAKRLCQLMGGDVVVTSEKGHGSTFTVRLPVEPGPLRLDTRSGLDRRRADRRGDAAGSPGEAAGGPGEAAGKPGEAAG
jgi:signal transduction histidine kinase